MAAESVEDGGRNSDADPGGDADGDADADADGDADADADGDADADADGDADGDADADADLPCDDGWGDCNGDAADGCEASLDTLENCGSCAPCARDHGRARCAGGSCELVACDQGWENCDQDAANGCETPLGTVDDCALCGDSCDLANATADCRGSVCRVATCQDGWGDCDEQASNGCEVSLVDNDSNCGRCGNACGGGDWCQSMQCDD